MIDDLMMQTKGSVLDFLSGLGGDKQYYSINYKCMEPLLENHQVYFYLTSSEMIIVALDPRPSRMAELADEEPFNEGRPLWFTESSHRESPVWRLAVTCEMIRERIHRLSLGPVKVRGVLLTGCEIINYNDIKPNWEVLDVSVFDRFGGLRSLNLPVNDSEDMDGSDMMSQVMDFGFSAANIKDAEKKLRRKQEKASRKASSQALFNFDDDDFELDFDFGDNKNDESASDYDFNDDEQREEDRLRTVIRNEKQNEDLLMNKLPDITVKVSAGACQSLYTDESVVVNLVAAKGASFRRNSLKCYIYTKDLHPMCNSNEDADIKCIRGKRLSMDMHVSDIWLPGSYFLLICEDTGKILRVDFTLDDNLNATMGERTDCLPCSTEDILVSCLENKVMEWNQLAFVPGAAQFRQWVIRRKQLDVFNNYRCFLHGRAIGFSSNLLIYTRNNDINKKFLDVLYSLSMIPDHTIQIEDCSQLYDASRPNPYENMNERLGSQRKRIFCLINLGMLLSSGGKVIVKRILDLISDRIDDNILWLCGTSHEIDGVLNLYPSLDNLFLKENRIYQEPYSCFDLVQAFRRRLFSEFHVIPDELKDTLARTILKGFSRQSVNAWSLEAINRHLVEEVRPRYLKHALSDIRSGELTVLSEDDLCLDRLMAGSSSFDESIRELNLMIGLDNVKSGIRTMATTALLFQERRRRGLKTSDDRAFHCVFAGNPGTGKTTVARMLGRIYHSLGLLSKGEVIAVDRTRLVGQFIGQTEENMKIVLEEARGNVLFIDEAYNLCTGSDDHKDFGHRVIDALMPVLSQPAPDMLVVFAGYPAEISKLLSSNPGLSGRFPYRYQFEDYTTDELMQIARNIFERDEYILTDEATAVLQDVIGETLRNRSKDFSNARWIENLVKHGVIPAMGDRVYTTGSDNYQNIEASDIRVAYEKFKYQTTEQKSGPKRVAGFCA